MNRLINLYRNKSFEEKTIFMTKFSVIFNLILAIGKIVLSFFKGVFFLVAGIVNIFIMLAKLECLLGSRKNDTKSFTYRNTLVGVFLLLAGVEYAIYMTRMVFTDTELSSYNMVLGVIIAFVSFVELGIAVYGCFKSSGKGHYYRNIKLINLCSAFTAIVLTEVAIMSFAADFDSRFIDGIFGMSVGFVIVLIAIFIFVAPSVSIIDREHNIYKAISKENIINDNHLKIALTNSKIYANYSYIAFKDGELLDGHIIKGSSPIKKWNVWILVLVITLSEILIFPYAIGAFVLYFKNRNLVKNLDNKLLEIGYRKILEKED